MATKPKTGPTPPSTPSAPGSGQEGEAQLIAVAEVAFSGPLPHPRILQLYDETSPGLAERIVKQAELQSAHRREMESKLLNGAITNERLGIGAGLLVTLPVILGGIYD